jgi:hypothetical protein
MLDWAIQQLSTQWAAVMAAPMILLPAAAFGIAIGWAWAWLVLRQSLANARERMEHHRDRAEFYKEKLDRKNQPMTATSEPTTLPVYATREQPSLRHSAIAKKLEEYWKDGTNMLNRTVSDEKARDQWLRQSRIWQEDLSNYLNLAGLGEEAAMFRTIPVEPQKRQFKQARDAEHAAGLNVLDQKLAKLRRILGRAADRAAR